MKLAARILAVLASIGAGAWLGFLALLGVTTLDAVLFQGRFLGWLVRLIVRAIFGNASPDAQEAAGFGALYLLVPLSLVGLLSLAVLLLLWARWLQRRTSE